MSAMPHMVPILYTQTGCRDSAKVCAWLGDHGIPVIERNVTGDMEAARELAGTGVFATPLLVTATQRVLGFRPKQLAIALVDERNEQ